MPKKGDNSQISWPERVTFFPEVCFLNSTSRFLKFYDNSQRSNSNIAGETYQENNGL